VQLPGQGLLDGTSMKRRDAVATVEASYVIPLRRR
jgi:hypothetical protein